MKKYLILLLFIAVTTISVNAQNLTQLMSDYDNEFALEHMELFTKEENQNNYWYLKKRFHRSIRIINIDATWLDNITGLVEQNPSIMYSYLDNSTTHNLAAYILLSYVFDIDMPLTGSGNSLCKESVNLNVLKYYTTEDDIDFHSGRTSIPSGQTPYEHMINSEWNEIAISNGVNVRLKAAINDR